MLTLLLYPLPQGVETPTLCTLDLIMTTQLTIQGMSCQHCVKAVIKALSQVPGVTDTPEVNLETGTATVSGTASPSALIAAIQEEGYDAKVRV